mmetsp:Transcript_19853/g.67242  ORF Transcript_19853/g.67242 Transcript_19853/m.67242 type:complete len:207 (+) Transcript_19853:1499-2119(+)
MANGTRSTTSHGDTTQTTTMQPPRLKPVAKTLPNVKGRMVSTLLWSSPILLSKRPLGFRSSHACGACMSAWRMLWKVFLAARTPHLDTVTVRTSTMMLLPSASPAYVLRSRRVLSPSSSSREDQRERNTSADTCSNCHVTCTATRKATTIQPPPAATYAPYTFPDTAPVARPSSSTNLLGPAPPPPPPLSEDADRGLHMSSPGWTL